MPVATGENKVSSSDIADTITNAVMEHRLAPGSKLSEARMAEAFQVSRTKIRQALTILAKSGLVQLSPNRGAFIASPTITEAREILGLRRLLEPVIVESVCKNAKTSDIKELKAHLAAEEDSRKNQKGRLLIRLTGDFHMLLARLSGNRYIDKIMGELCPLTCLVIALYDLPQAQACPDDEHQQLVEAIAKRDSDSAKAIMLHHLDHIESSLNLDGSNNDNEVDWDKIIG